MSNAQCQNRVRTPHTAATPKTTANATPVNRFEALLLLQPWSTAVIQTRNSRIAPAARAFIHMRVISSTHMSVTREDRLSQARRSHRYVKTPTESLPHRTRIPSLSACIRPSMRLRRSTLVAVPLLAVSLAVACTRQSQNPEEIREKTAQATANVKANATAVAQGVKEGLTRGNKVDLNNATKNQLMALPGITETAADRIIANRPYAAPEDLVKKKVLTPHEYDRISGQVGVK